MEQQNNHNNSDTGRRSRERNPQGSGTGSGYKDIANRAVHKEGDAKGDLLSTGNAPVAQVSMTVVGENVTFTQNFNF